MAPERSDGAAPRELRLEGASLALAGAVLLALLVGAFELGRRAERWSAPPRAAASSADSAAAGGSEPTDAPEKLTFFDTLSGQGKQAEPKREAAVKPGGASTPAPAARAVTEGPWFVQVFVGRDRSAAEEVVRTLRDKGYAVRVEAVSEGTSGSLFKVRVGGYPSREAAESGVLKLHQDGQASTWVVRVEG